MQEIQLLSEKLDILLGKYKALQAENERLKQTISGQVQTMEQLNRKLQQAEHRMQEMHLGQALQTEPEKQKLRKELDTVIGEIDKILYTLND